MTVRVVIADDRYGLGAVLGRAEQIAVVASVGDGGQLLRAAAEHRPDVVITDLSMPGLSTVRPARNSTDGWDAAGWAATRWGCGSGWRSPRRCWASRRCWSWTNRRTVSTQTGCTGCAGSSGPYAGGTVLVSSHQLAELAQTVDDVVIIHRGSLVEHASLTDLTTAETSLEDRFLDLTSEGTRS
jgi:hypothetical protein